MAANNDLLQTIKDVGDLREGIGAARANFEAARTNLESLERKLAERESEMEAMLRAQEKASRARASAPPAQPQKGSVAPAAAPTRASRPLKLRGNSRATRVVKLLGASPDRTFPIADIARHLNVEVRELYGTLSRLSVAHLIERVSDGVFRAAKKGGATAA